MNDLKAFRKVNQIRQKDLAEFLGISENFVSQIESGSSPLPHKHLVKILANKEWNTSMLQPGIAPSPKELMDNNKNLMEIIKSQQRTIEMQAHTIELLEKRGYSEDAQQEDHAGCAAANGE